MIVILLNWNPLRWTWDELAAIVERVRRGDTVEDRWSVGKRSSGVGPGDRFFMLRQGQEPRGIFGSGVIRCEPFQDEHWEREGLGNYINIDFETLINPDEEPHLVLPLNDLVAQFPDFPFNQVRASGWELPPDVAGALESLWQAHYGRAVHLARLPEETSPHEVFVEGAVRAVTVNAYERNAAAREACIDHWGTRCCVCHFDFEAVFGELGAGYIHAHHVVPLGDIRGEYAVDPINDLRPICPNCHAMIHRQSPALRVEDLRQIVDQNRAS